ncbi:exported hypothetical protein [Vibrio nigripulchritudo SOn1]|uniref:Uncharacterized protein n=1 Tax=Vibrio nigripulchritudo SOn1 TaxID=1238450 RepID=A0AAV2VQB5_9VIBR|nr:hypothetical protein [Vibrio nigripulchritudo]CCO46834.1 exported hypothetical protein [Vibrio nigripulchritudo SOn1]
MSKIRLAIKIGSLAALIALSMPSNAFLGGVLNWTIVDPVRDMNWYLKEVKSYLIAAERRLATLDRQISDSLQTMMSVRNSEANASAKIIAGTTSISATQNASSSERYEATDTPTVCSSLQTFVNLLGQDDDRGPNTKALCHLGEKSKSLKSRRMSDRFLHGSFADGNYYSRRVEEADGIEKVVIESIAQDVMFYAKTLTEYTVISDQDLDRLRDVNDLVFHQNVELPHPSTIDTELYPDNVESKFSEYFFANTYKAYIDRQLTDRRSTATAYAIDAPIIDASQPTKMKARANEIANAEFSSEALRLLAISESNALLHKYRRLDITLREQSALALQLKQQSDIR